MSQRVHSSRFNPDQTERVILNIRDEKDPKKKLMELDLPSRLSVPFGWWLKTRGILKT